MGLGKIYFQGLVVPGVGRVELPFFHCIHRSRHKNRVTTDYFGFHNIAASQDTNSGCNDAVQLRLGGIPDTREAL